MRQARLDMPVVAKPRTMLDRARVSLAVVWQVAAASTVSGQWVAERIAGTGDPVPGVPGTVFHHCLGTSIDDSGGVGMLCLYPSPGFPSLKQSIFYGHPGEVIPVQLYGQPAGLPGSNAPFQLWSQLPRLSKTGVISTRAQAGPLWP